MISKDTDKAETALFNVTKRCFTITEAGGIMINKNSTEEDLKEKLKILETSKKLFAVAIAETQQLLD